MKDNTSGEMTGAVEISEDWETITPVGDQVLILPDKPKNTTKAGIVLPDRVRIPVVRGRVLAVSYPIIQGYKEADTPVAHMIDVNDRVIFHWGNALPQDFEADRSSVLISINNILAKIKTKPEKTNGLKSPRPAGIT